MGRKRKGSSASILGAAAVGLLALVAAVPVEVWLFVSGAVLAFFAYRHFKEKPSSEPPATQPIPQTKAMPRPHVRAPRSSDVDEPISLASTVASSPSADTSEYRLPAAPKGFGKATWLSEGQPVNVSGFSIPGGLIYVGTHLKTPSGDNDPCLIDPSLSVSKSGDYTERQMGYWPSYGAISSSARGAYLKWLAGGRQAPSADIGYVFLFFYGLERRAILDASTDDSAKADWPTIATELRRLLDIYGEKSGSFRRYASELLNWVSLAEHPARLYERAVPSFPRSRELPLYVRVALGQAAVDGVPVPAALALTWVKLEPSVPLYSPATRCSDEFSSLFMQRYEEQFGAGMLLPRNRTKLKLMYRPASAGFNGYQQPTLTFNGLPDVSVLTAPLRKLQDLVQRVTRELEPYSRLLGASSVSKHSLEALLYLPTSVWPDHVQRALQQLKNRIGDGMVAMPFQDLLGALGGTTLFTREKVRRLAQALDSASVGIEPDILAGAKAPKAGDTIVLFALPSSEQLSRVNGPYLAATLTLQLASAVATSDGEFGIKEMGHLRETVLSWTHLTPGQKRRLLAHLRLLMQAPASLTALKKKFEPLELNVKETIAAFMATVAQSDGEVSPGEVKMLEKVYKALGVDSKKVFSDVHAVAAGAKPTAAAVAKVEESGFKLDPARIAALQKDTEKVSALLANIFTDTDEPAVAAAAPVEAETENEPSEASAGLLGLDEAHTSLARMMLSRPEWSRAELLDVAADLDLMLDGALEHINEAAFEAHDMALFEGEDPVTVNAEILDKVEA